MTPNRPEVTRPVLAICGHSGAGKTTLIERLAPCNVSVFERLSAPEPAVKKFLKRSAPRDCLPAPISTYPLSAAQIGLGGRIQHIGQYPASWAAGLYSKPLPNRRLGAAVEFW